ncbi:MAG: magnesium/cobalt transporter CorA, partial [Pseudomonadales bacterium]
SGVTPGELAGIEHLPDVDVPPAPDEVKVSYIDYSIDRIESGEAKDLDQFLASPKPDWVRVRWINISSIHPYVVNLFRNHFEFHTLTAEDVLHIPQRPRVEFFDDHLFVVLRMLQLIKPGAPDAVAVDDLMLDTEQVSLFLFEDVLITFQERQGDVWQPIRARLQTENTRLRRNGAGYLLYALLDAIVDHCFPVLEQYGDVLEDLELVTLEQPTPDVLHRIHSIKRELALLRRIVWPMREVTDQLYREEQGRINEATRPYLRDVYEHTIQIVEIIESYREMAGGLTDLYMSAVSNRMNEIMKVLTIMASVFIPLTFIAGVYGMNFEFMPELKEPWAYPVIWGVFILVTTAMLYFFRHKGWIGRG